MSKRREALQKELADLSKKNIEAFMGLVDAYLRFTEKLGKHLKAPRLSGGNEFQNVLKELIKKEDMARNVLTSDDLERIRQCQKKTVKILHHIFNSDGAGLT